MKTNRPFVYEVPHKSIRNLLSKLSLMSGSADYDNAGDLEKLSEIMKDTVTILESHAKHEDNVTLKYLEEKIPGSSSYDTEDHVKIEKELIRLEENLKKISEMKDNRNYEGNNFYLQVSDFHSKYLQHMLEEERITQTLIWENFTDEEILQQEAEIMSSVPPGEMLLMCKYMMPAFGQNARLFMLNKIKKMAPPEFFKMILEVTKSVLSKEEFSDLENDLN